MLIIASQSSLPSPPSLVLYGPYATGKSSIIKAYLESSQLRHAIIRCQECVTGRHLLERTVGAVYEALRGEDDEDEIGEYTARCENISTPKRMVRGFKRGMSRKYPLSAAA